jgi:hypothetical protein
MVENLIVQGRLITQREIDQISNLIACNPDLSQWKLSQKLCELWAWRNAKGVQKDMACRSLLKKLENKGFIQLPELRRSCPNRMRDKSNLLSLLPALSTGRSLEEVVPIYFEVVKSGSFSWKLFSTLLARHHYLGYKGSVGEHIDYLLWDKEGRPLGCMLFGAAAWKVRSRDRYIGWEAEDRESNLHKIVNNMRFLLLSQIPNLASYVLGRVCRRIGEDFYEKYGHRVVLLETFVERGRYLGTCYQASNWIYVGDTQGRSRNDRRNTLSVPVKQIYLYPLEKRFRESLKRKARLNIEPLKQES